MPFGFPLRTRITKGVLLTILFCGRACQSVVIRPPCLSLWASRSIERVATWDWVWKAILTVLISSVGVALANHFNAPFNLQTRQLGHKKRLFCRAHIPIIDVECQPC